MSGRCSYDKSACRKDLAVYMDLMEEDGGRDRSRLKRRVSTALRQEVTYRQRQYLLLYYGRNMKIEDIAREMGVNKSTVSRTLQRGRARLKRCLRYGAEDLLRE